MVWGQAWSRGPVAAVRAAEFTAGALTPLVAQDADRGVIAFAILLPGAAPRAGTRPQSEGGGAPTRHPPVRDSASHQPPRFGRISIGVHHRAGAVEGIKRLNPPPPRPR